MPGMGDGKVLRYGVREFKSRREEGIVNGKKLELRKVESIGESEIRPVIQ